MAAGTLVSGRSDETARPGRRGGKCPLVAGLVLLGVFVFHLYMYIKFTPVYTATECGSEQAIFDDLDLDEDIVVKLRIMVQCRNPNPYTIRIGASTPGGVFVGTPTPQTKIGKLEVLQGSTLPREGSGEVRVRMNTHLSGPSGDMLIERFLKDAAVPVLMELQFNVGVSLSFGLQSWQISVPYKKKCGLNIAGILINQYGAKSRIGPLVCRKTFEELQIPPVGFVPQTPADGNMEFTAAQMAPDKVRQGELAKNISLLTVMGVCLLFGPFCLWCALCGVPEWLRELLDQASSLQERFLAFWNTPVQTGSQGNCGALASAAVPSNLCAEIVPLVSNKGNVDTTRQPYQTAEDKDMFPPLYPLPSDHSTSAWEASHNARNRPRSKEPVGGPTRSAPPGARRPSPEPDQRNPASSRGGESAKLTDRRSASHQASGAYSDRPGTSDTRNPRASSPEYVSPRRPRESSPEYLGGARDRESSHGSGPGGAPVRSRLLSGERQPLEPSSRAGRDRAGSRDDTGSTDITDWSEAINRGRANSRGGSR